MLWFAKCSCAKRDSVIVSVCRCGTDSLMFNNEMVFHCFFKMEHCCPQSGLVPQMYIYIYMFSIIF